MAPLARMTNELTALSTTATNARLRRALPGGAAWGRRTMMHSEFMRRAAMMMSEPAIGVAGFVMMVVRRVVRRSRLFSES
jgi:hypothetical protein